METPQPPIGIIPEYLWKEKRRDALVDAILRYVNSPYQVPVEWVVELNKLSGLPPNPTGDRYPMGKDQPAQIDCRVTGCKFYREGGTCTNPAPAITLNPDKKFVCWSEKPKDTILKNREWISECPSRHVNQFRRPDGRIVCRDCGKVW